ncbi:hypothetical protein ACLRDC_17790 [Gluconacetobacter sacchari]|uniref:hypothetical protein n=1 Tax=Gluconacetobacter sacchari TaxID=92759 RepID=UPI0039B594C7
MAGYQQTLRRAELIKMTGITDFALSSCICTPLTSLAKNPDARVVPYDELYRSAISQCISTLPTVPDVVVSGLGGDELTMEASFAGSNDLGQGYDEPLVRAANLLIGGVPSFKSEINYGPMGSTALGTICRSDQFLTLGIWPKNPLTDPSIVRFSQLLPSSLKSGRMLNVLALTKIGLSDFFIMRRYKENFRVAFETDLRNFDVDAFFRDGYVEQFQLASIAALSIQHEKFVNDGRCDIPLMVFANISLLEKVLRRIKNRVNISTQNL